MPADSGARRPAPACQSVGPPYCAFLLLGAPGEGSDSVRESVEPLPRFEPARVSVGVGVRLLRWAR